MTAVTADEAYRVPAQPRIGESIRAAAIDFYFNSWRLVPANALWGMGLILIIGLAFAWPLGSLITAVLLGLPTVGIYRLAALIVRDRPVSFSDALSAWRQFLRPALAISAGMVGISIVLSLNLYVGLTSLDLFSWAVGTLAGWGLIVTWAVALLAWPLIVDPVRDGQPLIARLQLAATLLLVAPLRVGALVLLMAVVFVVSAVLFAALLSISIAFIALVTTRYVLPAADRLEGRATKLVQG